MKKHSRKGSFDSELLFSIICSFEKVSLAKQKEEKKVSSSEDEQDEEDDIELGEYELNMILSCYD